MRKSLSILFLLLAVSLGAWGQSFTITVGSTSAVSIVTNTYATMVTVVQTSGTSANFIVNASGIPVFLPSGGSFLFVSSQGFGAGTTVGTIQATSGGGVNVLVSQQQLPVPPNAVSQVIFSGTTIPSASASGLCLVSTGTGQGQWAFSSCSGSASTNFSTLIADAPNISGGSFQIGNGTTLAPTGSGTITANLVPTTGLVFPGSSSGRATVVAQAAALTPTLTLPTATGTFAVSASGLLALNATTGALTCANCASTQNPLSQFASTTSAQFLGVISNASGTGLVVGNNSPTFITPTLGVATAMSINGIGIAGTSGKTLTVNNSLTFNGTDSTTMTFPTTSQTIPGLGQANTWTAGLQTFTAATVSLPASASYAPTTAGLFGYDSTNGRLVFGNGSATGIPIWITGTITSGQCPQFSGTTGLTVSAACGSGGGGNVSTGTSPNSPAQYYVAVFSNSTTVGGIATGTSGYPLLANGGSSYPTFGQVNLGTGVTGTLTAAETPAFTGGDIQSAGATLTLTAVSVHGVTYPATPSTNTVPVVTASNTVTYEVVPAAALVGSGATTVNSQTCTLGASCTLPFQVNGAGLTSQAGINHVTSTTNAVGLTATPVNGSGNHVTFEITGASYTGNAATASNLSGCTPSAAGDICYYTGSAWTKLAGNSSTALVLQEASGVPSWVSAGTGNTTSTSLTTNTIPVANGANSIINSLLTDNATTLSYSGTGGLSLGVSGTAGVAYLHQGTAAPGTATTAIGLAAPTSVTAHDIVFPSAASSGYEKWSTTVNQTGCTASTTNLCGFIESSISLTADVSGSLPLANGGCAGTTQQTCLNNVMPGSPSAGEVAYYNGTNWVGLAGNSSGVGYLSENSSGAPSWNSGISGPLSAIVSATGTNTIANGNFAQVWNWALTGSSVTAFTFGETTAASGTSDQLVAITTASGSTAVPLTVSGSLTGSQAIPAVNIKCTWNTSGVVDACFLVNVTNTASGTGSLIIDLQVGGTSQFSVDKAGNASVASSLAVGASSGTAGLDGVGGATSNPSLTGYTTGYQGFMGATSGASASYFGQFPAAAPTAGQVLSWGAPSSNISTLSWITPGTVTSITAGTGLSGGTITGSGTIALIGGAGQIYAGATPALTSTPTLGASGTLGSLTFGNATSGLLTIEPVTGALGTVTASIPDNTGTIAELNLGQTWTAVQALGSSTATTQTAGDNTTDIATDAFVTTAVANAVAGVNPAVAVLAASTANLTGTYTQVGGGVGDTFTITATGAFTLDGVAINTIGQRVLFKNQSTAAQNGVYTATTVGTTGISAIFTRALDYDTPSDVNNTGAIPVQSETVNTTTSWLLTSQVTSIGSSGSSLIYAQFTYNPSTLISPITFQSSAVTASIGPANIISSVSSSGLIHLDWEIDTTVVGSSCTGATAVTFGVIYTTPGMTNNTVASITSFAGTSGTLTFTTSTQSLASNQWITLTGFTGGNTGLNGQLVQVLSAGLTTTAFEAIVTGTGYSGGSATGSALFTQMLAAPNVGPNQLTSSANGFVAPDANGSEALNVKSGTAVQYATNYTVGASCSPAPTYQVSGRWF